eukprot:1146874-Pelagomonas_calceolata.AAC.7
MDVLCAAMTEDSSVSGKICAKFLQAYFIIFKLFSTNYRAQVAELNSMLEDLTKTKKATIHIAMINLPLRKKFCSYLINGARRKKVPCAQELLAMAGFKAKSGPVSLLWLLALATATAAPEIDLQLVLDVLSSSFSLNSTGVNSTGLDTGAVSYTLSNLDKGNSRNGLDCADNEDEEGERMPCLCLACACSGKMLASNMRCPSPRKPRAADHGLFLFGWSCADIVRAPLATRQQKNITQHGDTRQDPYFWCVCTAVASPF